MTDVLKRKEYLVGLTIIEGRNIFGKDNAGTSDPFVKVRCAGREQQTSRKEEVNNATWNQTLSFPGILMNKYELETFEIMLELYDYNPIFTNEMIGQYSIGLSTLHRNLNHEFYKVWVGMFHQDEPNKVQGYLQISAFIIGPNEKPPFHSSDDKFGEDQLEPGSDEDEDAIERKIQIIQKAQGVIQVVNPNMIDRSYQLGVTIIRGKELCLLGGNQMQAFISVRANGCVLTTKVQSRKVAEWKEKLMFPVFFPVLNNKITVRLWSKSNMWSSNKFIANIPELPDALDFFNITKLQANEGRMKARWFNLYGTKPDERTDETKSLTEGTQYLGRILMAMTLITASKPILQKASAMEVTEPKERYWQLWVDLYEIIEIDLLDESDMLKASISIGNRDMKEKSITVDFKVRKPKKEKTDKTQSKQNEEERIKWTYKNSGPDKKKFKYKAEDDETINKKLLLPADATQIPDIFINFYNKNLKRIAYVRIPAKFVETTEFELNPASMKPRWFSMKSPYNNTQGRKIGSLLTGIQLVRMNDKDVIPERVTFQRNVDEKWYRFFYHIHHGFELATMIKEKKLNTYVQLTITDYNKKNKTKPLKIFETDNKAGRYPIWNKIECEDIQLGDLSFEPDMRIQLKNKVEGSLFTSDKIENIGECVVPLSSMALKTLNFKPMFFNMINEEQQFVGQICCNFWLAPSQDRYFKETNKKYNKGLAENLKKIWEDYKSKLEELCKVDLTVSILGIRNLISKATLPKLTLKITNQSDQDEIVIRLTDIEKHKVQDKEQERDVDRTYDPNFGIIRKFNAISLSKQTLFWPYLTVQLVDENRENPLISNLNLNKGCEQCYTTITLNDIIEFTQLPEVEGLDKEKFMQEIMYARVMISRNQDRLDMVQNLISEQKFFQQNYESLKVDMNLLTQNTQATESGITSTLASSQNTILTTMSGENGTMVKILGEEGDNIDLQRQGSFRKTKDKGEKQRKLFDDLAYDMDKFKQELKLNESLEDILKNTGGKKDKKKAIMNNISDLDESEEESLFGPDQNVQTTIDPLETGIVIDKEISFLATEPKKKTEDEERQIFIDAYTAEIKYYMSEVVDEKDKINKDKIKEKIIDLRDQVEGLKKEKMDDDKFWGLLGLNQEEEFDYQRDVLKDGNFESKQMELPYKLYPFFTKKDWRKDETQKPTVQVSGILRSGNLSGALLKANIKMEISKEETEEQKKIGQPDEKKQEKKKLQDYTPVRIPAEQVAPIPLGETKWDRILREYKEYSKQYPFDFMRQDWLNSLVQDTQTYRVRVYMISAQNLTAQSTSLDWKSRLAGFTALCTANPYFKIIIGHPDAKQEDDDKKSGIRRHDSREENCVEKNLNPKFFQMIEMDASFPQDWKLEIQIWNKGMFSILDNLIGSTVIDLENRLHSNQRYNNKKSMKVFDDAFKQIEGSNQSETNRALKKQTANELKVLKKKLVKDAKNLNLLQSVVIPVEFRELMHPNKNQAQGCVEMWVELHQMEDAAEAFKPKLQSVKKEYWEIRLIVWETRQVPLIDGDKVNIFVTIKYDPTGRPEEFIEKKTDIHNGSKTGWGDFKWRFKLPLVTPCEFPVISFTINHSGLFTDDKVGDTSLNLKNTIAKLMKEGSIDIPKTFVSCSHPNFPDEVRGTLMFSITILPQEDADADPVGESWDEPNHSPWLRKPTAGRGLGALMKGFSFNFDFDFSWNPFGKYLPYVCCLIIILGLLTAAMYLKMFGL